MNNDPHQKLKILVIVGTVRQGRVGRTIAEWYMTEAQKVACEINMELELFDISEYDLPVFNEAIPPLLHHYGKTQQTLAEKINQADGFVFVTGEYNHSVPGSLKNFIDYVFAEWNYKAATYVGYSVTGGLRAIEHLVQIMTELKVVSVANSFNTISIVNIIEAFDTDGKLKPDYIHGNIETQLQELSFWASALKEARRKKSS